MNIEFHDLENLRKVTVTHSVAPARPSRLFTTRPALLNYIDYSMDSPRVRSLDCSALPSKPKTSGVSISTQKKEVWDFCSVPNADRQLMVIAHGLTKWFLLKNGQTNKIKSDSELWAFDTDTGGLEWTIKGKLSGMEKEMCAEALASDGHGILFVYDTNNSCVEMFSANGTFTHVFLREGEQGLGKLKMILWHSNSLIVAHKKDSEFCNISKVGLRIVIKVCK